MNIKPKSKILLCILSFAMSTAVAQKQATIKKYRLLTYGLLDLKRRNASEIIQSKWDIEIYAVTGCIVSGELEDSIKRENIVTEKLIASTYGKNWEKRFDGEVEKEFQIELQIDSLIKLQSFIKDKEIVNLIPGAPFPMHPIDTKGNYIVSVSSYNRDWKEQKLYQLKVNYKNKSINIVQDYTGDK